MPENGEHPGSPPELERNVKRPRPDRTIETRTGDVWLGEDRILRCVHDLDVLIEADDAREILAAERGLLGDDRAPILVDLNNGKVTRQARAVFAGPEHADNVTAMALLVRNPVMRVMGIVFMRVNRPPVPCRIFSVEEKALAWARRHRPGTPHLEVV